MARRKKIRAQVGDVFAIPIQENCNCFGQIVTYSTASHSHLYILFDFESGTTPDLETITSKPILAIAHLDDFSIEDGDWSVIGNTEVVLKNIKLPNFLTGPKPDVIDYDGKLLREATKEDLLELDYPGNYTSNIFDSIAVARFGNKEWDNSYDELLFDPDKWISKDELPQRHTPPEDDIDEDDDAITVTIHYKLNSSGFGAPEDLDKRYLIEDLLNERLRVNGIGDCDGGEIGNGEMFIFCRVINYEEAIEVIKDELEKHDLLKGATIQ
ncbi:Imm26 family immunity protein [Cohnella sp. CFH 77786]|uniref:Imm26 family immunity protein n=1 Tax=Cohnella sp. CFH 77786 TaxID=2662265 RepID=UPI001C60C8C9